MNALCERYKRPVPSFAGLGMRSCSIVPAPLDGASSLCVPPGLRLMQVMLMVLTPFQIGPANATD
jgi:hypothetical protein